MQNIYDPNFVKQLFNQMASSYERMNYITSFGFSIRWRKQFLRKVGNSNEQLEVIDLLSGLGENWKILKNNFPNARFSALDFSEVMVQNSQTKAAKLFSNDYQLICDNVLSNQLPSNHFDIVTCAFGLKTFNEEQLHILAKEVHRILKPTGKFTFVEVSAPKNKLLHVFYSFYLGKLIPLFGKLFLGNPDDYKMLWIYTSKFQDSNAVSTIFEKHQLKVRNDRYFYGCATGISGEKT